MQHFPYTIQHFRENESIFLLQNSSSYQQGVVCLELRQPFRLNLVRPIVRSGEPERARREQRSDLNVAPTAESEAAGILTPAKHIMFDTQFLVF